MPNLIDIFKKDGLKNAVTSKLQQLDPNLDPSKGAIANQLFANFLGRGQKKVQQTIPEAVAAPVNPVQTPQPTAQPVEQDPYAGLSQVKPPKDISELILKSSQETGLDPSILAAILWNESGYNPRALNDEDRGIAQINRRAFPNITDAQAYDPHFAIPFMARTIKGYLDKTGDLHTAIAAYNVGIGRAPNRGPIGKSYVKRVARNLTPDFTSSLGLEQ